jgi:hypothetical protein
MVDFATEAHEGSLQDESRMQKYYEEIVVFSIFSDIERKLRP